MDTDKTIFRVPGFERKKAYNFEATNDSFEIYQELKEIGEEIERCRLRNS